MKIASILTITIFTTTIIGAPQPEYGPTKHIQRRVNRSRFRRSVSSTAEAIPQATLTAQATPTSQTTVDVSPSENWAGVIIANPPDGLTFTSVTGTITVPSSEDTDDTRVAFWVGIDGNDPGSPLIQAGFDIFITGGTITYTAWQEWVPDPVDDIDSDEFLVASGNVIQITVALANNNSEAAVKLVNTSTGQEYSGTIYAPSTADNAVGKSVEWIAERIPLSDDSSGDGWYPFTNFGVASFTNCAAVTSDGASQDLTGAEPITMETNVFIDGTDLAFGQVVDGSTASITWQAAS